MNRLRHTPETAWGLNAEVDVGRVFLVVRFFLRGVVYHGLS
jgi:hypothetical protein